MNERQVEQRQGFLAALGAFTLWGFAPLYFKLLGHVNAVEIIAHRVIWAVVFLLIVLGFRHRSGLLKHIRLEKRRLLALAGSGLLIGLNWLIFVYAVNSDRVLSTSLGYFINPLVSVFLGMIFFQERMTGLQWLAIALAAGGTTHLTLQLGEFPWIALSLAVSFGFYGVVRKKVEVGPMVGLLWETLLMLPLALGGLVWLNQKGLLSQAPEDGKLMITLAGTGLITVLPLILFAAGVRRLNLSTIGFMQYIAPSLTFTMAVFWFKEPFGIHHAITFGSIWLALILYTLSGWFNRVRT